MNVFESIRALLGITPVEGPTLPPPPAAGAVCSPVILPESPDRVDAGINRATRIRAYDERTRQRQARAVAYYRERGSSLNCLSPAGTTRNSVKPTSPAAKSVSPGSVKPASSAGKPLSRTSQSLPSQRRAPRECVPAGRPSPLPERTHHNP